MSVIGGRKKQKFTFNPRVETTWSQDANKFGQKMLERMGWKSGQGLGKNENGITDSVRASFKNDNQGLGFKEITEGSVQQDNFNIFLQSLNKSLEGEPINTSVNDVPLNSLEKKSERSRVRVHYRKVTRGKDISQYSEKDLANIFCRRNLKDVNEKMQEKMDAEINGGHMDSYFKHKMESKKQSKHSANDNNSTNFESFCIETKSKKNEVSKPSFVSYLDDSANGDIKNKKKRRKFKECLDQSFSSPFKKFRSGESEDSGVGIVNPAFESLGNNVTVLTKDFDINQESSTHIAEGNIKVEEIEENPYEVKLKKKKKKKQLCGDQVNDVNFGSDAKSKKQTGIDNPLLNLDDSVVSVSTDKSQQFEVKRKKHKKASKLGVENVALNLSNANLSLQSIEKFKSPANGTENSEYSDFVLKSVLTPQGNNKLKRRKSVRFSETNEEFLIPNRNAQEVDEKNELFEINIVTKQNSMQDSDNVKGIVNNGFDIRSKDASNVDPKNVYKSGIDNQAYDAKNQNVEEAIKSLTDTIDQYQAEVENGINESKAKKRKRKSLEIKTVATQE